MLYFVSAFPVWRYVLIDTSLSMPGKHPSVMWTTLCILWHSLTWCCLVVTCLSILLGPRPQYAGGRLERTASTWRLSSACMRLARRRSSRASAATFLRRRQARSSAPPLESGPNRNSCALVSSLAFPETSVIQLHIGLTESRLGSGLKADMFFPVTFSSYRYTARYYNITNNTNELENARLDESFIQFPLKPCSFPMGVRGHSVYHSVIINRMGTM